jgi:hypothetical protein
MEVGFPVGACMAKFVAFADDIVLISRCPAEAANQLSILETELRAWGLSMAPEKSAAFQMVVRGKTWATKDPGLRCANDISIPFRGPGEILSCLGVDLNPWDRDGGNAVGAGLLRAVKNCAGAGLKPSQKIEMTVRHLIPRALYVLLEDTSSWTRLTSLDSEIRHIFKSILRLPSSVSSGFLYTQTDRGLGLPRLANLVPLACLRAGASLSNL